MGGRFDVTTVIERPIEEVFAFLANGENDPKFRARALRSRRPPMGRRASTRSTRAL
jgi:hypothetical protein